MRTLAHSPVHTSQVGNTRLAIFLSKFKRGYCRRRAPQTARVWVGIRGTTLSAMRPCLACESTGSLDDSGAEYLGTRNTAVHAHRFNPAAQSEQVIFIYRVARLSLRKRHGWVERLSPVPACLNNMSNASALGIP